MDAVPSEILCKIAIHCNSYARHAFARTCLANMKATAELAINYGPSYIVDTVIACDTMAFEQAHIAAWERYFDPSLIFGCYVCKKQNNEIIEIIGIVYRVKFILDPEWITRQLLRAKTPLSAWQFLEYRGLIHPPGIFTKLGSAKMYDIAAYLAIIGYEIKSKSSINCVIASGNYAAFRMIRPKLLQCQKQCKSDNILYAPADPIVLSCALPPN